MKKHRIVIAEVLPYVSIMNAAAIERLSDGLKRAVGELSLPDYVSPEAMWFLEGGGLEKYLPESIVDAILEERGAK
jgi:hypothetical protein